MKPMVLNSTHFVSYHNIEVKDIDLFEDAWGFNSEFSDMIDLLRQTNITPGRRVTKRLIKLIRKQD